MLSPFQLGANALLFLSVNMYGVFVRVLAERSQRKAFLQARSYIEDRLRLEDENEKQVGAGGSPLQGTGQHSWGHGAGWGARTAECGPGVQGWEHPVGSMELGVEMLRGLRQEETGQRQWGLRRRGGGGPATLCGPSLSLPIGQTVCPGDPVGLGGGRESCRARPVGLLPCRG